MTNPLERAQDDDVVAPAGAAAALLAVVAHLSDPAGIVLELYRGAFLSGVAAFLIGLAARGKQPVLGIAVAAAVGAWLALVAGTFVALRSAAPVAP